MGTVTMLMMMISQEELESSDSDSSVKKENMKSTITIIEKTYIFLNLEELHFTIKNML